MLNGSVSEDDDMECTSHLSTTKSSDDDNLQSIQDKLSKRESIAVLRLRIMVIGVLVCAAIAVSVVVYKITRQAQVEEFEIQYEGNADKVVTSFTDILKQMGTVSGLGIAASAASIDTRSQWPFVTLSNFQERARNAQILSGTLFVSVNPIVSGGQRSLWESYVQSSQNNYWM